MLNYLLNIFRYLLTICFLALSACGQKGDLYWPDKGPSHPKQDHDLVKMKRENIDAN